MRPSASFRLLSGTAMLCGLAQIAPAQEARVLELDPIVMRSLDEQGSAADRGNSVYVTEAEIERARDGDLKDLFSGLSSVSVGGALPVAQKIFVNGIDMLNLSVIVDGVAQNNRAFHHVTANAIDPGLLKSVRADAGVAAADAGPHALAGAVVMETIDADDILDVGKAFGGNLRLSYGDNGRTFQPALTLAGKAGGFEGLAYVKRATGEEYRDGDGARIPGSQADLSSLLLKGAYESPEGHRVELSFQDLEDRSDRPWRANIGEVLGSTPEPTRIYDTRRRSVSLAYENTQASGLWDPKLVLGYSESRIDVPEPWGSEGLSSALSLTAQNTFHLGAEDTITAGLDYYDRLGRYEGIDDPRKEETAENVGLFAQARLHPLDRLDLSFGARSDWQSFEGIGGQRLSTDGLSGNASVAYELTDRITARAGYSTVFGGIAIEDNYLYVPSWTYDALDPARSENRVLGLDYRDGRLTLSGELFWTEVRNARNRTENFDFESEGFNLSLGYGWDRGFARLSFTRSDVTADGAAADSFTVQDYGAPLGDVLAFEIQHEFDTAITLGGSLDMAFDYDRSGRTAEGTDTGLDGYEVVNVFAEYRPASFENLTLRAEVSNLFDASYADRATYGVDFGNEIVPLKEPGRTFTLSMVTRF